MGPAKLTSGRHFATKLLEPWAAALASALPAALGVRTQLSFHFSWRRKASLCGDGHTSCTTRTLWRAACQPPFCFFCWATLSPRLPLASGAHGPPPALTPRRASVSGLCPRARGPAATSSHPVEGRKEGGMCKGHRVSSEVPACPQLWILGKSLLP